MSRVARPHRREFLADSLTPLGAYRRLARLSPMRFLLESVTGGEQVSRYSFLGAEASEIYRLYPDRLEVGRRGAFELLSGPPLEALCRSLTAIGGERGPIPFEGGFVGYFGYDLVRLLERLPPPPPRLVGVFVNRSVDEIGEIVTRLGLDQIQFHGDETAAEIGPLAARAIVAVRLDEGWGAEKLEPYGTAWGFLFEARHPHLFGGTGASWPYERLAGLGLERPFLVAGGIGPENAGRALSRSRAWGVDVCSGVESRPGVKDPDRMRRLFEEVRHAAREA